VFEHRQLDGGGCLFRQTTGWRSAVLQKDEGSTAPCHHRLDVHRILLNVASGPAEVFGTSGGAVTGLALVARYSEQVTTLVAHEPPVAEALLEAERAREQAAAEDVYRTFRIHGAAAWPKFMAINGFPPPAPVHPPRDASPPSTQDQADGDRMLAHWMRPCVYSGPIWLRCGPPRPASSPGSAMRPPAISSCGARPTPWSPSSAYRSSPSLAATPVS
jgi:pimeloyl-ACP methyl ester carboxylesterase